MNAEQEFADLKFKIECREMVLTKNGGPPLVVRGPGEIWQNEEGVLQFKVFADRAGFTSLFEHSFQPTVAGQLVPDEDYFTLVAHDYSLPESRWVARRVLPWPRGLFRDGLAYGGLSELELTQEHPRETDSDVVVIRFREKIKFPCNISTQTSVKVGGQDRKESHSFNAAQVVDGDFRFEFHHESEHTVVTLQMPKGRLTASTPLRIHEALRLPRFSGHAG